MTVTAAPPPDIRDVPGVTRRHRPSDLYHERTNFQFIKHSRRWLVISGTLVVLSLLLLSVRGLNLGIDFEGGTAWQVQMKGAKSAKVAEVRSLLGTLGFNNANVSVLAFTDPVSCTVIANSAGYFQPPRRSERITKAVIHGMPAHGPSSTLVCDEN